LTLNPPLLAILTVVLKTLTRACQPPSAILSCVLLTLCCIAARYFYNPAISAFLWHLPPMPAFRRACLNPQLLTRKPLPEHVNPHQPYLNVFWGPGPACCHHLLLCAECLLRPQQLLAPLTKRQRANIDKASHRQRSPKKSLVPLCQPMLVRHAPWVAPSVSTHHYETCLLGCSLCVNPYLSDMPLGLFPLCQPMLTRPAPWVGAGQQPEPWHW